MAQPIQEIKGYELGDMLGEGGFGTVYRAYQPLIRRDVAIKVIRASFANKPEFVKRFEAEAQLVARLEHLHIVPLYDFWRDPSGAYLVMRLLRGGSLRDELQTRGRLPIDEVVRIITQISSALSVAHRKGVVHRDLKPANILLDEEKNSYLTDFGIAKDVERDIDDEEDDSVVGTPAYSPPEQLQSLVPTPQSDIYSFGLIIYELITGRDAMAGDSISDAIRNQLYEPLPYINPDQFGIPIIINDILATATAKNPDDRYADVMLFARDFKHAIAGFRSNPSLALNTETGEMVIVPEDTMSFSINLDDIGPSTGAQLAIINPYKGLRAFQESDASDFYGRAELTQQLITRLNEDRADARFLAVIGPSGSGKSSVVKAGVIPALRNGALPESEDFYVAEMVPGADALEELESVLLSIAIFPPDNLRETLAASETGLFDLLNQILPDDGSELFLLIDQFEEIFTQTEDNRVRTHFMNSLQYAVTHPESRLWAVITIRADFYDKPLLYPKFGELVRERGEIVLPLSRLELESAIVQPAKTMGVEMEKDLIAHIIQDVQEEPGALPLLQYALTELFDRRSGMLMTLDTYQDSGGVLGSLARRAEELYLEMDDVHQEAIRQMFLRLVTLGEGTEDTRRRVRWSELSFYDGDTDPMADVRDTFTKYRLLTGDNDPQTREPTIEVAHEALIRQWQRLRDWLADNRDNIRVQRQVVAAVNEWHQNDSDKSYLASGMRLEQFELLLDSSDIALTLEEKSYIVASIEQREAAIRAERERQAREQALEERAQRNLRYLVGAMTIGLVIASILAIVALTQRQNAIQAQRVAEREAIENNSISLSNLARFWGRTSDEPLLGLGYAVDANTIPNPPVEVQQTLAELAWQPGARRQLIGHEYEVWGVAYSYDGLSVFSGDGSLSISDGNLIQWDTQTGDILQSFEGGHTDRIYSVATSPDGRYVATGSQDTRVIIWEIATGEPRHILDNHTGVIFDVMFTNDSSRLLSADGNSTIVWNVETGALINQYNTLHDDIILDMDITADDRLVFSGSFDTTIKLWELDTGNVLLSLQAGQITGAQFFPDEMRAVTTDQNGDLIVWDLATGDATLTITHEETALRGGVAVTQDGQRVIAGDQNGNVMVWDISRADTQPILFFRGHESRIPSLDISPISNEVVTASFDRSLIIWDIDGRHAEIERLTENTSRVYASNMSADGRFIASGATNGDIIIWEAISGEVLHRIQSTAGIVYDVAFSSDSTRLASAHEDGTIALWDTTSGDNIRLLSDLQAPARTVVFSSDSRLIAAAGGQIQVSNARPADNQIIIWDDDGTIVQTLNGHDAAVRTLAFTPDDEQLFSGSDDTSILSWSVETGDLIRSYQGHQDSVWSISLNASGSQLLSGSLDNTIIHWDIATGNILGQLEEHTSEVRAVAFHPDGIHAVSGAGSIDESGSSSDYDLLYWDINQQVVLREIPGHTQTIRSLTFNTDGTQILSASDDGLVILWHADTLDSLLARISTDYEVICVEDHINDYCENVIAVASDETNETVTVSFPSQDETLTTYAEDSLCLIPNDGQAPPNEMVTTQAFAQDGAYIIGYSNSGVAGSSSDWIAAWAEYQADQEADISELFVRNANGNLSQQIRDIQLLIDSGINALIINPIEQSANDSDALQASLNAVIEMGIPVIVVGNRPAGMAYTTYVGHDPYEVGCIMAQELIALLDGEGTLGIINAVDLSLADQSFKDGERAALSDYQGLVVIAEGPTGYSLTNARNITSNVAVDGILGYVGSITLAAQDGIASQGLDYVPFVTDHSIESAQFARNNGIPSAFIASSTTMGADAIQAALAILRGEPVTQFIRIVPTLITSNTLDDIDIDNAPIDGYLGDWQDLPESYYP